MRINEFWTSMCPFMSGSTPFVRSNRWFFPFAPVTWSAVMQVREPEGLETLIPSLFCSPRLLVLIPSILLAILVQALSMSARAEVQVTGGPDPMKIEAKEASVEELLIAPSDTVSG